MTSFQVGDNSLYYWSSANEKQKADKENYEISPGYTEQM